MTKKQVLRGCPTCGTKVAETQGGLGLRDYRWVAKYLPGKVSPSDLDSVIERNGRFLVMETKPEGMALNMGQRILLKRLVRKDFDVWVVWGGDALDPDSWCQVGRMDRNGDVQDITDLTVDALGRLVGAWFSKATQAGDTDEA